MQEKSAAKRKRRWKKRKDELGGDNRGERGRKEEQSKVGLRRRKGEKRRWRKRRETGERR